jgi:hypothetical protein
VKISVDTQRQTAHFVRNKTGNGAGPNKAKAAAFHMKRRNTQDFEKKK